MIDEQALPRILDYEFQNQELLRAALTHRSFGRDNNERLEYLGDAVLAFVVAEVLFLRFPDAPEGMLTRLRALLVRRETLAGLARELQLGDHIRLGGGERKTGGWRRDSTLANTLEALIGAVYLDSGMDACRRFVLKLYEPRLQELALVDPGKDPKTTLQEFLQARRWPLPVYEVVAEQGAAHSKTFRVRCLVPRLERDVIAEGRSRRTAEQAAAQLALDLLASECH